MTSHGSVISVTTFDIIQSIAKTRPNVSFVHKIMNSKYAQINDKKCANCGASHTASQQCGRGCLTIESNLKKKIFNRLMLPFHGPYCNIGRAHPHFQNAQVQWVGNLHMKYI